MPADFFSSILGWLIMGTGNDNNSWGTNWNNSVGTILEKAIAGVAVHAVTGGTLDLSGSPPPAAPSQMLEAVHQFTGVLGATQTVIVPNVPKQYLIQNFTTGAFGLKIKTPTGVAVNAPAGRATPIFSDGTGVCHRLNKHEVGTFCHCGGANVSGGAFPCTGGTKLIADYPDLFAVLGTTWGGDGITTFGIPNATTTGGFLRSSSPALSFPVGATQANQNLSHGHSASGLTVSGSCSVSVTVSGVDNPAGAHTHGAGDNGHSHGFTTVFPLALGLAAGVAGVNVFGGTTGDNTSTGFASISVSGVGDHQHSMTLSGGGGGSISGSTTGGTVTASGGTEARPNALVCTMGIYF